MDRSLRRERGWFHKLDNFELVSLSMCSCFVAYSCVL